jgi:hypothetical protein
MSFRSVAAATRACAEAGSTVLEAPYWQHQHSAEERGAEINRAEGRHADKGDDACCDAGGASVEGLVGRLLRARRCRGRARRRVHVDKPRRRCTEPAAHLLGRRVRDRRFGQIGQFVVRLCRSFVMRRHGSLRLEGRPKVCRATPRRLCASG